MVKRQTLIPTLIITLAISLVYFQVYSFNFLNFDDNIYVSQNPTVLNGLSLEGVRWAFSSTLGGHWHPLTWLSLMADISLFGANPGLMHLSNLAFHILNTLLLFFLIRVVTKKTSVALVSTLLFALHPLRIESVAWISQRKDLLSLSLGLVTALLYFRSIQTRSAFFYVLSLVTFVLALLTKSTMMTWPLLLIILELGMNLSQKAERAPLNKISAHYNKIPYFLISITFAALALYSQSKGGGLRSFDELPLSSRINMIFPGYIAYLGKLFWPFETSIFYPVVHYPSGLAFGCCLSLIILTINFWTLRHRFPELILGWIWFLIALVPMIGIIPIGAQALADRWTQLAHIGPIVALTSLAIRISPKSIKLLSTPLILVMSCFTFSQLQYWRNSESVFRRALEVSPENFLAHTNLGATLINPENFKERVYHFEEAVRLNPTYPEALNNLGTVRAQQGRFVEAKNLFEKAVSINPELLEARNNLEQVKIDINQQENFHH